MSLQDILAQTVQEALSEREDTIIEEEPPRRGLFSRRKMRDTEQLYDDAEGGRRVRRARTRAPRAAADQKRSPTTAPSFPGATKARRGAGIFTLLLCVMAVLEHFFHPAGGVHR